MRVQKKHVVRVDLLVNKGAEEVLPEFVPAECGGVWIEEANAYALIKCYPHNPTAFLAHLRTSGLPLVKTTLVKEELQDYAALTKKYFRPITIEGVTIVAPWQKRTRKGPVIIIDPGMAFGTGRHESTRLMLRMMNRIDLNKKKVLDIGCGSGILSIRAAQKGSLVWAIDRDPLATTAAQHNSALNGVQTIQLACTDVENLRGRFDVVLANLDYDTVFTHYDALISRVSKGGLLLISGIEDQYKDRLRAVFSAHTPVRSLRMNDWHAFTFRIS